MNFLAVRLAIWLLNLIIFPLPVTLLPQSFALEVLERITLDAPARERMERHSVHSTELDWTERVLARLTDAEKKEVDPWYRDDLRIAWITTRWSQHGIPSWSLHGYATPYVAATWQVLHCHPDQVWPRILANREAKLGKLHQQIWGEASSPRKPVQSVKLGEVRRRNRTA